MGLWFAAGSAAAIQEIRIGVLSHRGTDLTLEHWQPTADYLSSTLEGYRFEIIPLPFSRISTNSVMRLKGSGMISKR